MRSQEYWCIDRVGTNTDEGSVEDPYVYIRPVHELVYQNSEYQSGGRTISHEDAVLIAEFLELENLAPKARKCFRMPGSVTSFVDVLTLLVQRAKARKQIPRWVPPLLVPALPGSENWDADREASEQVLTARIARIASGDFADRYTLEGGIDYRTSTVPLRYRRSDFEGRLIIRRNTWFGASPDEYVWIGIERLTPSNESEGTRRSVDLSCQDEPRSNPSTDVDEDSYQLPITDPVRFDRLICELTEARPGI